MYLVDAMWKYGKDLIGAMQHDMTTNYLALYRTIIRNHLLPVLNPTMVFVLDARPSGDALLQAQWE